MKNDDRDEWLEEHLTGEYTKQTAALVREIRRMDQEISERSEKFHALVSRCAHLEATGEFPDTPSQFLKTLDEREKAVWNIVKTVHMTPLSEVKEPVRNTIAAKLKVSKEVARKLLMRVAHKRDKHELRDLRRKHSKLSIDNKLLKEKMDRVESDLQVWLSV